MSELKFQQKAVRRLVDMTTDLLRLSGSRQTLIFKAPTGSGKTVMAAQMLAGLTEELLSRGDSPYSEVAQIWIAPNKLHQQSYQKMKSLFAETRLLRPVMYDELDQADGVIKPGERQPTRAQRCSDASTRRWRYASRPLPRPTQTT